MAGGTAVLESAEQVVAITHPTRLRVLDALREPDSAAGVARRLGEPRQRINHHVRELARAGLLIEAGERRKGAFVERLFESAAGTFVVSSRLTWGDGDRLRAIAEQFSLRHLVDVGDRIQRDAATLLDRAAFGGAEVPGLAVEATVTFADDGARASFLDEYLELTARLIEKHTSGHGEPFLVTLVAHPRVEDNR